MAIKFWLNVSPLPVLNTEINKDEDVLCSPDISCVWVLRDPRSHVREVVKIFDNVRIHHEQVDINCDNNVIIRNMFIIRGKQSEKLILAERSKSKFFGIWLGLGLWQLHRAKITWLIVTSGHSSCFQLGSTPPQLQCSPAWRRRLSWRRRVEVQCRRSWRSGSHQERRTSRAGEPGEPRPCTDILTFHAAECSHWSRVPSRPRSFYWSQAWELWKHWLGLYHRSSRHMWDK